MRVNLKPWIKEDKNLDMNSEFFMGTTIQSMGDLKGYTVQILFMGMAVPSHVVQTNGDALKMQDEIWRAMTEASIGKDVIFTDARLEREGAL